LSPSRASSGKQRKPGTTRHDALARGHGNVDPGAQRAADQAGDDTSAASRGVVVRQEIGAIHEGQVQRLLRGAQDGPIRHCFEQGYARMPSLSGSVTILLRIGVGGRVVAGQFLRTTLGSRDVEGCIMQSLVRIQWPEPQGGDAAEVRSEFGWEPADERLIVRWPAETVTRAIASDTAVQRNLAQCRSGATGTFQITGYVDESGRFVSLGGSAPSLNLVNALDCMVQALTSLELPVPTAPIAKVTFGV